MLTRRFPAVFGSSYPRVVSRCFCPCSVCPSPLMTGLPAPLRPAVCHGIVPAVIRTPLSLLFWRWLSSVLSRRVSGAARTKAAHLDRSGAVGRAPVRNTRRLCSLDTDCLRRLLFAEASVVCGAAVTRAIGAARRQKAASPRLGHPPLTVTAACLPRRNRSSSVTSLLPVRQAARRLLRPLRGGDVPCRLHSAVRS